MTRDEFIAALTAERFGEPVREYRPLRLDPEVEKRRARQDAEVGQWEARRKSLERAVEKRAEERRRYLGRAG